MKTCVKCFASLSKESFRTTRDHYTQPYCRICERKLRKEYYYRDLEKSRSLGRDKALARAYGITREEFNSTLVEQNNSCAICGIKEPGGRGNWHVDHNHTTDKVRGLLCHKCNTGLGLFLESETILKLAIAYIRKHNDIK